MTYHLVWYVRLSFHEIHPVEEKTKKKTILESKALFQ